MLPTDRPVLHAHTMLSAFNAYAVSRQPALREHRMHERFFRSANEYEHAHALLQYHEI